MRLNASCFWIDILFNFYTTDQKHCCSHVLRWKQKHKIMSSLVHHHAFTQNPELNEQSLMKSANIWWTFWKAFGFFSIGIPPPTPRLLKEPNGRLSNEKESNGLIILILGIKIRNIKEFLFHWQEHWGLEKLYDPSKASLDISSTAMTRTYFSYIYSFLNSKKYCVNYQKYLHFISYINNTYYIYYMPTVYPPWELEWVGICKGYLIKGSSR